MTDLPSAVNSPWCHNCDEFCVIDKAQQQEIGQTRCACCGDMPRSGIRTRVPSCWPEGLAFIDTGRGMTWSLPEVRWFDADHAAALITMGCLTEIDRLIGDYRKLGSVAKSILRIPGPVERAVEAIKMLHRAKDASDG